MDRLGEVRAVFADVDLSRRGNLFAFGVAYGRALERERIDAEDQSIAAEASQHIRQVIGWADARQA